MIRPFPGILGFFLSNIFSKLLPPQSNLYLLTTQPARLQQLQLTVALPIR